jgi:hypothetical protein
MRLPDFIIPGVMKSGTTSLHYYLSQHPDIFMPVGKLQETHFFDYDVNFAQGLSWYEDRLSGWSNSQLLGQTCPNYLGVSKVPRRIHDMMPGVKFIVVLRNPVDRAYSHYWHEVKKNRETLGFEDALAFETKRISKNEVEWRYFCYRLRGQYYLHISEFLTFFPIKNFHFVIYEEMRQNSLLEINRCFEFLGLQQLKSIQSETIHNKTVIPKSFLLKRVIRSPKLNLFPAIGVLRSLELKHNTIHSYPVMKERTREELNEFFKPSNLKLEKLIGRDLSIWK